MKKMFLMLALLCAGVAGAQTHKIGIGPGLVYMRKPAVDLNYQFGYRMVLLRAGFMQSAGYPKEFYKNLSSFYAGLAIQSDEEKPFGFYVGLGFNHLRARNHAHPVNSELLYTEPQTNFMFNAGLRYSLSARHQLGLNFYLSEIKFTTQYTDEYAYAKSTESRLTLCYMYRFGRDIYP